MYKMGSTQVNDDITAYQANYRCFTPGLSKTQVITNYTDWAQTYNKTLCSGRYNGPEIAAAEVAARIPEERRQHVRIIDIAAGTGKVGVELSKKGFTIIDALEPSEGMLDVLRETGVYSTKYQEFLGIGQNSVPDDTYDVLTIVGGMGEGHVPVQGVDDMIRITKPGGLVIIVMREEYLYEVNEYKDRLVPHMDFLQQKGYWTKVEMKTISNYAFGKDGIVFTYRVL